MEFDFPITANDPLSVAFLQKGIYNFSNALQYVRHLPYGRNPDKTRLESVLEEGRGTCSTKHALLFQLARIHNQGNVLLCMGIFRMSGKNTPRVAATLAAHKLDYIPEAHNYLSVAGIRVDCTHAHAQPSDFLPDLLVETTILPEQITGYKVQYHRNYLQQWLLKHPEIPYTLEELWTIREQCIQDLSVKG
ncbi:hypothetical protein [Edaphocola flava]|uniref:hypothetical protein n=1 Tax=Edaphocola flava TaxID=2499629 RepID=UPI00100AB0EB|nr:hypothetical protein [Edaphocola flava]